MENSADGWIRKDIDPLQDIANVLQMTIMVKSTGEVRHPKIRR